MKPGTPRIGVGFDFDHTLGIDNKLERVAFLHLLESFPEQESTLAQETEQIDQLLAQQRSGAFTIDAAVERYARAHGASDNFEPYIERFKRFALDGVDDFVVALPGLRDMLNAMQRDGFAVAILSNGWSPLQDLKAKCVGFNGPVIVSDRIGAQKPEVRAFEALLKTLGTTPSETWYVGDNPTADVAGSINAGLRAVWVDEGGDYPSGLPQPSARITDLRQLRDLLKP